MPAAKKGSKKGGRKGRSRSKSRSKSLARRGASRQRTGGYEGLRVRLSGGSNRQKFDSFANKEEVKDFIKANVRAKITFVTSGEADYIVVPNHVWSASMTASSGGGIVLSLDEFMRKMSE